LRQIRDLLDELDAPLGVYATLGSPPVDLRHTIVPLFDGSPIRLLRDDRVMIDAGHGRKLQVLGLDCSHFLERDGARLARLMADTDPKDGPVLLLYHSPELMPEAVSHGIDIYVCGHTHGGQVRVPWLGPVITSSQLGRRYVMGHYHEGTTHLYVSRGIGLEGLSAPRVRFLSPPEVTVVTLRGIRDERQQGA
jgi:predicted MPP superfamily phosphohydrolase